MNLPKFSLERPVTTVMIYTGIILLGFISLSKLAQDLFPPITYPQLTIVTIYENAAPEETETLITKPIEEVVGTVSGLRRITSISKEGISLVIAEFGWGQNMDFAALGVREKIDLIKERLPRESQEPIVMKFNPFELPVVTLSVTSDLSQLELRELCQDVIKDELEKLEGVASATITGGREREILVALDKARLYASEISLIDVSKKITEANLNYPGGTIKESFYEYLIRTLGEFKNASEIDAVAVGVDRDEAYDKNQTDDRYDRTLRENRLIRVQDIAQVRETLKEQTSYARQNQQPSVTIAVQKQAQANTIAVVSRIKLAIKRLEKEVLYGNTHIQIIYDQSTFIKSAINGVRDSAWQGGVLAFLVLLVFLRRPISSAIVALSIPISVMVVFTFMYFGNVSVNMMSLGGLALGVGMLIDNGIVVVENIHQHMTRGKPVRQAAEEATTEVTNAVIASTLTTIAVFVPMIFVIGIAGQLFKQLAFTITWSLVASLFVSLTIIPLLIASCKEKPIEVDESGTRTKWERLYTRLLPVAVERRWLTVSIALAIFIMAIFSFRFIDKELMPKTDQGQFIVKVTMPRGTKLDVTNRVAERVEKTLATITEIENVTVTVGSTRGDSTKDVLTMLGSHEAQIMVGLWHKRKKTTQQVVASLKNELNSTDLEGGELTYVMQESILATGMEQSAPISIEVKGEDLTVLKKLSEQVKENLAKIDGITTVEDNRALPSPETKVVINKDKAALYGLSVADIAQSAQIALRGYVPTKLKKGSKEIDIRIQFQEKERDSVAQLQRVMIPSSLGIQVPLMEVARIGVGKGPSEIKRYDQQRTILVFAFIAHRPLKDIISEVKTMLAEMKIPTEYTVKMAGLTEEMQESFASLIFALILSVVLVYMIMAAQFESIWQPFIIIGTVPMAVIGVVISLFISQVTLNVISALGVIMLGGIVVNNGIVLIDYANILRGQGLPAQEAIVRAGRMRLRPVLMTALTTILGLVPMAMARGEGSELQTPMAITVMGGLFSSTFLTLVVIPALYMAENDIRSRLMVLMGKGSHKGAV